MGLKIPNFLGKYNKNFLLLLLIIALGSLGQLLMKNGVKNSNISSLYELIHVVLHPLVLVGLATYILSAGLWLIILTRLPLSVAYPFGALSYVLVVVVSALSGESISASRIIGILFITVGILIVGNSSSKSAS